ncbi:hypothetical protein G3I76_20800, partial [Streptomyces sp. SID11233]|nr:hypothetical protein [Streptomyces sp. SID11233]
EAGLGVRGTVEGLEVRVGRGALLEGLPVPEELTRAKAAAEADGATAVLVAWDGRVRGLLAVADAVKESSAEAV